MNIGDRFERLEVISESFMEKGYRKVWVRCDCGAEKTTRVQSLKRGRTKSCGCYQKSRVREANTKHGGHESRLYNIWDGIIQRCTNPKCPAYENYGRKGIRVHDEWRGSFEAFQEWAESAGYRDDLTIDRIDGRRGYCPENCRFTTRTVQSQNCRKRRNNQSGYVGVCRAKGKGRYVAYASLNYRRIHLGYYSMPIEAARVRDDFVKEHYEAPMLNFPEEGMKA